MTEFIESFATQQLLPPWEARGAQSWCFAVRLSEDAVRNYLEKHFNGAYPDSAPYYFSPLPGPQFGLLTACYFPSVASNNKTTQERLGLYVSWDHISHTEIYLAIPVLRQALDKNNLIVGPASVVWIQPFVCSDSPTVVFSSREIWGSDIAIAKIFRDLNAAADEFHLDTAILGIKNYSPRSVNETLAFIHIRTHGQSLIDIQTTINSDPDVAHLIYILSHSGLFVGQKQASGSTDSPAGIELNNLKQFRDAYDMDAAIYRAIIASRTSHTDVDSLKLYEASKVEIAFMWSDSVAENLKSLFNVQGPNASGPPDGHERTCAPAGRDDVDWNMDRVVIKAEFAFSFTSNVNFEVIETIHTYGIFS